MRKIDVNEFRQLLLARQKELEELNHMTSDDVSPVELDQSSIGRLSRMDALQQQAMSEETRRRRMTELAQIDAALQRIKTNEYGFCTICGEDIAEARLRLNPAVPVCIDHAKT